MVFLVLAWALTSRRGFPRPCFTAYSGAGLELYGPVRQPHAEPVFFTCFLLAVLLLALRPGNSAILLAGLGGVRLPCARGDSSGGLGSGILLWKRDRRAARAFCSLPAVVAYLVVEDASAQSHDVLLYYVDYMAFEGDRRIG